MQPNRSCLTFGVMNQHSSRHRVHSCRRYHHSPLWPMLEALLQGMSPSGFVRRPFTRRSTGSSVARAPLASIFVRKCRHAGLRRESWVWKAERGYSRRQVRQTRERRWPWSSMTSMRTLARAMAHTCTPACNHIHHVSQFASVSNQVEKACLPLQSSCSAPGSHSPSPPLASSKSSSTNPYWYPNCF